MIFVQPSQLFTKAHERLGRGQDPFPWNWSVLYVHTSHFVCVASRKHTFATSYSRRTHRLVSSCNHKIAFQYFFLFAIRTFDTHVRISMSISTILRRPSSNPIFSIYILLDKQFWTSPFPIFLDGRTWLERCGIS